MHKIYLFSFLILFATNCDIFNPDDPEDQISNQADAEGNIVVINNSGESLVLYDAGIAERIIPNTSEEFLIKIPNPNGVTKDLWLFKESDVSNDVNNPDSELLFRRWNVNLSADYEIEHRVSWVLSADAVDAESGTLILSYNPGTENSVDVYLNSENGARIATLMPGQSGSNVGVDYGNYQLYYKYWYSDPNTTEGSITQGWLTPDDVPNMSFILNNAFPVTYRIIPHLDSEEEIVNGEILIQNNTDSILIISADTNLIENIMVYDGPIANMSSLPPYSQYLYVLPANNYHLSASDASGNIESQIDIDIEAGEQYDWTIDGE
ncbi:hypothetical protein HOE22_08790 [Candidatus Woesearchaeota archaeon]|jgi:hypothetical protein|nr:hypothetical protein [Candidatus Woesearchaeota archaeon]MBT7884745.1 hypothetical protein [Candidatus Neomarinimicrobiota bacterium]